MTTLESIIDTLAEFVTEGMLATKRGFTEIAKNGWTVKLQGGGVAAHFEKTVTV